MKVRLFIAILCAMLGGPSSAQTPTTAAAESRFAYVDVFVDSHDKPLAAYQFEFDGNDMLTIHIQCWAFQVSASVLPSGPNSRIRIDFYANTNVAFEVSFRERLLSPWTRTAFATTPTGPANQSSLVGSGGDVSVYVDRSTASGFYAVGMKLAQV